MGAVPGVQDKFVKDTQRLYRSDFFPGLGWMLRNALWQEIKCVQQTRA